MATFVLSDDYIELNKLLKAAGLCDTGGMAKMAIDNGLVTVDGTAEYRKRCKIRHGNTVVYEGHIIHVAQAMP